MKAAAVEKKEVAKTKRAAKAAAKAIKRDEKVTKAKRASGLTPLPPPPVDSTANYCRLMCGAPLFDDQGRLLSSMEIRNSEDFKKWFENIKEKPNISEQ